MICPEETSAAELRAWFDRRNQAHARALDLENRALRALLATHRPEDEPDVIATDWVDPYLNCR